MAARGPAIRSRSLTSRATKPAAEEGGVSRPSRKPCTAMRGASSRSPSSTQASRWVSMAWTPPLPISPMRWSVPPVRSRCAPRLRNGARRKKSPRWMLREMRTKSWGTTRPAPRFRWPTSLLPIWPSGRPTASPLASRRVWGSDSQSPCHTGVRPSSIALPSRPSRYPHPSRTTSATGAAAPRVRPFDMLLREVYYRIVTVEPQSSPPVRGLPASFCAGAALVGTLLFQAPARLGQETPFLREPGGLRLATLAAGARVAPGRTAGDYTEVTFTGWIWSASLRPDRRDGYELSVRANGGEKVRAAPDGELLGRAVEGALFSRVSRRGGWTLVRRTGWVSRAALAAPVVARASPPAPPPAPPPPAPRAL